MSGFYPARNFGQFWADPIFSAVRGTFLAEEEAQNLATRILAIFGPPSQRCLAGYLLVKTSPAEGRRRFHKNTAYARLGV